MVTSSDSEVSDDNTNNKDKSTTNVLDYVDDGDKVDLIKIQQSIKRSQSILAGSVIDTTLLRDKLAMADQNVEETRTRQQDRAKKKLARRLNARATAFHGPDTTVTSTTTSSTPKNEDNSQIMCNNLIEGEDENNEDGEAFEFQSAQFQRQRRSSGSSSGSSRRISIRHSRSSVLKRRESAMLEHQQIQHLQQLSLLDKDTNNNDTSTVTTSTSPDSQFKPAMRNILETQRRLSRRGSDIVFELMQAQNDATLLQEMELADKKAAIHTRLNARLKNRQLVDDILVSSADEEDKDVTDSDIDVISSDSSVDDAVVVNKVVARKNKVKRKQTQKRKTKMAFNRNRQKMKNNRKTLKTTRKNSRIKGLTAATIALVKKKIMTHPIYEDEEDDDENNNNTNASHYVNESDSDSDFVDG